MMLCGWHYLSDRLLCCHGFIHFSSSSRTVAAVRLHTRVFCYVCSSRPCLYFWLLSLHLFYFHRPCSICMKQAPARRVNERPVPSRKCLRRRRRAYSADCYRRGAGSDGQRHGLHSLPWSGIRYDGACSSLHGWRLHPTRSQFVVHQTLSDRDEYGPAHAAIFRIHKAWVWWDWYRTGVGRARTWGRRLLQVQNESAKERLQRRTPLSERVLPPASPSLRHHRLLYLLIPRVRLLCWCRSTAAAAVDFVAPMLLPGNVQQLRPVQKSVNEVRRLKEMFSFLLFSASLYLCGLQPLIVVLPSFLWSNQLSGLLRFIAQSTS